MTKKFHILNVQEGLAGHAKDGRCVSSRNRETRRNDLESHAKDGRCGLSRNEDIRR